MVDPIDGTRPAMAGFEAACVSVAAARLDSDREARMGDVVTGCVVEIKSGRAFVAERGGGLDPAPSLSANRDLSRMFWAYGLRGRPVRAIAEVLGELIDASSVGGGDLRPRLGDLRHDPDRDRPARRVHRAGPEDRGGRPRNARGVRAGGGRRGAQQLPLRPGGGGADPRGGRGGGHRRVRRAARRAASARLRRRVSDLVRRGGEPGAARSDRPRARPRHRAARRAGSA